jgi:hypothetical protein
MNSFEKIQNVKSLKNGLKLTDKFNPIVYDTTNNYDKIEKNIPGLLAEDVIEFYPELVKLNERGDIVSVNYIKIIPLLISAIKELNFNLKLAHNKIKELESKTIKNTSDSELSFLNIFKK